MADVDMADAETPPLCQGGFGLHRHEQTMANTEDRATLKKAYDGLRTANEELSRLNVSGHNLRETQDPLRHSINKLSRPFLRNLHILDMPDEILLLILNLVRGSQHDKRSEWHIGTEDIRNCRLTCRRLCSLGDPMLIRLIRLRLTPSSLERLGEISRHPTISKGVQAIRVVLCAYKRRFNDDVNELIDFHLGEVGRILAIIEIKECWVHGDGPHNRRHFSEEEWLEVVSKARTTLAAWRQFQETGSCDDEQHRVLLETTHQKYQGLYEVQESIRWHKVLPRAVASAVARMPRVRSLQFDGADPWAFELRSFIRPGEDVHGAIYHTMLEPTTAHHADDQRLDVDSCIFIPKTIHYVRETGIRLHSIVINLSFLEDIQYLLPRPKHQEGVLSTMQQLRDFKLHINRCASEDHSEKLVQVLKLHLDAPNLERLTLSLWEGNSGWGVGWGVGLTSHPWRNLTNIEMCGIALDLSDLRIFLKRIQPTLIALTMQLFELRTGTWEEALDALREKSYRSFEIILPSGAECNDLPKQEVDEIFAYDHGDTGMSRVELYVRNLLTDNPLRVIRDNEETVQDDADNTEANVEDTEGLEGNLDNTQGDTA